MPRPVGPVHVSPRALSVGDLGAAALPAAPTREPLFFRSLHAVNVALIGDTSNPRSPGPGPWFGTRDYHGCEEPRDSATVVAMDDIARLAELLHETAEHHDPFEKAAPRTTGGTGTPRT